MIQQFILGKVMLSGGTIASRDYIIWNFVRMRIKVTKLRCFDSEILEKSCFEQAKPVRVWPNLTQNCDTEFHHNCEQSSAVNQLTKTRTAQNFDLTKIWIGYPPPEGDGDFCHWLSKRNHNDGGVVSNAGVLVLVCILVALVTLLFLYLPAHGAFIDKYAAKTFNKTVKCFLHQSKTLTLFTQETLPAIGAEAHGLQRGLRDACRSVTAGVALASAELAQSARVEWAALAKPVLRIAKIGETEGGISPEVKSGQWICSNISRQPPEGTVWDAMTQQPTLECLEALKKM